MAKRRKPLHRSIDRPVGKPKPVNVRIPWLRLLRVVALALIGVTATGWALDRALHVKHAPMFVPRVTSSAWPPPGTIDVTDVDLGAGTSPSAGAIGKSATTAPTPSVVQSGSPPRMSP